MAKNSGTASGSNSNWMSALQAGSKRRQRSRPEPEPGKQPPCVRYRDILMKSVSAPVATPIVTAKY